MIYKKNNNYYVKVGDVYYLADVVVKARTILVNRTNEYVTELDGAIEIDYLDLKARYIKRESTDKS